MTAPYSASRQPLVLSLALLVLVILGTVAGLMAVVYSQGSASRSVHLGQVALGDVMRDQLDEETGVRGFQASGSLVFLEPYQTARAALRLDLADLRAAFEARAIRAESPATRRAMRLEEINREWDSTVAQPILTGRVARDDAFVTVQGKILIDRFRAVVAQMDASLQRAADDNQRDVQRNIIYVGAVGAAIALLVALAMARLIRETGTLERRIQQEAELKEERSLLAEAMPQIVWQADAAGFATFFNSRCYAYTGLTPQTALGTGWLTAIHPDDRERVKLRWEAALANGSLYEVEYRIRDGASGEYRWFLGRGNPVPGPAGRVERWIGTCTDIDDQKRLEAAVRESAAAFESLADVVPQLIWVADRVGDLQYANRRWREYTGLAQERIEASEGWELVHPDDRAEAASAWKYAAQSGRDFEAEYRLRRHDGIYRWFLVRGKAVKGDAGEIARWFGTCTDIDVQREAHDSLMTEFEREHRVSDSFQRAALPKVLPQGERFSIHAVYRAASTETFVGGDWFDAFVLDGGRIAVSVGDVMGKGLDAAITMNAVRQCIRGTARVVQYPTTILDAVDQAIRDDEPDAMVTAFLGILDTASMTLTYANAGHPPPLVRSLDGSVRELRGGGLPIGYRKFRSRHEPAETVDLSSASFVALYTDGLTEATRNANEGERRLRLAISGPGILDAPNPAEALAGALLGIATPDDVAILTISIHPSTASNGRAQRGLPRVEPLTAS